MSEHPSASAKTTDIRQQTIYSLMIDRFGDGDPASPFDRVFNVATGTYESANSGQSEFDPSHGNPYRFWGGDLKGVTQAVTDNYLSDLGIGILHLTPFQQNVYYDPDLFIATAYHGYHPENPFRVDPRFGELADYKEMSGLLKERDIGIMMDWVYNHSNARCNPASLGRILLRDGTQLTSIVDQSNADRNYTVPDKGFYLDFNDHIDAMWVVDHTNNNVVVSTRDRHTVEFSRSAENAGAWSHEPCTVDRISQPGGLADLNYHSADWNSHVASIGQTMIDAVLYWIGEADGTIRMVRFDAAGMVPPEYTKYLMREVLDRVSRGGSPSGLYMTAYIPELITTSPNPFRIANDDGEATRQWKRSVALPFAPMFDSRQLTTYDYSTYLYFKTVAQPSTVELGLEALAKAWKSKPNSPSSNLIAFIASHDHDRLATSDLGMKKVLLTMLMASPRIPLVYYGEEGGRLPLIDVPGFERSRAFFGAEGRKAARSTPEFAVVARLSRMRHDTPALWKGGFVVRRIGSGASAGLFAFERFTGKSRALVVVNASKAPVKLRQIRTLLPDGVYSNKLEGIEGADDLASIRVSKGAIKTATAKGRGPSPVSRVKLGSYSIGVFVR